MSTLVTILIVALMLGVIAAAGAVILLPKLRSRRLQQQFGPEYQRALAQHDGDAGEAERELAERVRQVGELDLHPLDPADRERYLARWAGLQEQFVDAPGKSVIDADRLLTEVLRERGYPEGDQSAALSVHHAGALAGYRASRDAAARAEHGDTTTEQLRDAFVRARGTFDELVQESGGVHADAASTKERTSR